MRGGSREVTKKRIFLPLFSEVRTCSACDRVNGKDDPIVGRISQFRNHRPEPVTNRSYRPYPVSFQQHQEDESTGAFMARKINRPLARLLSLSPRPSLFQIHPSTNAPSSLWICPYKYIVQTPLNAILYPPPPPPPPPPPLVMYKDAIYKQNKLCTPNESRFVPVHRNEARRRMNINVRSIFP